MPSLQPSSQSIRRIAPLAVTALAVLAASSVAAVPAWSKTVTFTNVAPSHTTPARLPFGTTATPKLGVSGVVHFATTAADDRAIATHRTAEELRAQATERTAASTLAAKRIDAITAALEDAQDDEARLAAIIQERMVAQYKEGEAGPLDFLLSSGSLGDLVRRGHVLKESQARDDRTMQEYELTIARIETYKRVLEEIRNVNSDQALRLTAHADRLDELVVAQQVGHDEAPLDEEQGSAPKGVGGTWYVMEGAFEAQLFMPSGASGYKGGTRTPRRAATPAQIQMILQDKRITIDASGMQDIASGQIDGRLLDALEAAAVQFGSLTITSLKSDHGTYTSSGNVSEHAFGCAADIGSIGGTYITPSSQVPGGTVQQAVMFFAAMQGDLAPHQVISLFDLGGATLAMGDHGDHIHLGYAC